MNHLVNETLNADVQRYETLSLGIAYTFENKVFYREQSAQYELFDLAYRTYLRII